MLLVNVVTFVLNVISDDCDVLLPSANRKLPTVVLMKSSRCTSVLFEGTTAVWTSLADTAKGCVATFGEIEGGCTTGKLIVELTEDAGVVAVALATVMLGILARSPLKI